MGVFEPRLLNGARKWHGARLSADDDALRKWSAAVRAASVATSLLPVFHLASDAMLWSRHRRVAWPEENGEEHDHT